MLGFTDNLKSIRSYQLINNSLPVPGYYMKETYRWGSFGLALSEWSKVFGGAALGALEKQARISAHLCMTDTMVYLLWYTCSAEVYKKLFAKICMSFDKQMRGEVMRWRAVYLLDCRACSSKAFWFHLAPGTNWGCLGTKDFLQKNQFWRFFIFFVLSSYLIIGLWGRD